MAHWRDDQKGFWRLSTLSVECQYLSVFLTPESILEIAVSIAVASALVVLPHVLACQDKINIFVSTWSSLLLMLDKTLSGMVAAGDHSVCRC